MRAATKARERICKAGTHSDREFVHLEKIIIAEALKLTDEGSQRYRLA